MYLAYATAAWNWRYLEFSIPLLLVDIYPGSFALVAAYGLLDSGARLSCGALVGAYLDRCGEVAAALALGFGLRTPPPLLWTLSQGLRKNIERN